MTVARYWRKQDQRYNLAGSKCNVCGGKHFPMRNMCPECHRRSLGKIERFVFSGEGEIISYTVVHEGVIHFRDQLPYVLAMIELKEGDMVLGQIVDCETSEVQIGKKVEMVFRKLSEDGKSGTIQYGYKFRMKG